MKSETKDPHSEWKRIMTDGSDSVAEMDKVSEQLADEAARRARQIVVKDMGTLTVVDVHRNPESAMAVHSGDWRTEPK